MFWWVILIILGIIVLFYMLIGFFIHYTLFGKRFKKDPIIKYYSVEMFEGLNKEPIEFNYKKGKIKGFIYSYNHNENNELIVFSHGMFSNHEAYLQEIEYFAKNGYSVLGFDYYGVEYSDGKNQRGLGNSLACLDYVINNILKSNKFSKINVVGHSWGGFASLCIAKYHFRINKIVVMSPFVKATNLLLDKVPPILYPALPFFMFKDLINCGKYILDNGIKILSDSKIKTLIIHSKDDHMVKYYKNTYLLTEYVNKDNIEYLILNGKKHNPNYDIEAINYSLKINEELNVLKKSDILDYRKNIDYQLLGKLDIVIMDKIVDFLKKE